MDNKLEGISGDPLNEEEYWRKQFLKTEGFEPTMWQLMQYVVIMEEQAKQHKQFWGGLLGL